MSVDVCKLYRLERVIKKRIYTAELGQRKARLLTVQARNEGRARAFRYVLEQLQKAIEENDDS